MTAVCRREAPVEAFEGQNEQLQSPQQYGIWEVDGLGLVVAFRGTSSWNDVFVDINVRPTPLTTEQGKQCKLHAAVHRLLAIYTCEKSLPATSLPHEQGQQCKLHPAVCCSPEQH